MFRLRLWNGSLGKAEGCKPDTGIWPNLGQKQRGIWIPPFITCSLRSWAQTTYVTQLHTFSEVKATQNSPVWGLVSPLEFKVKLLIKSLLISRPIPSVRFLEMLTDSFLGSRLHSNHEQNQEKSWGRNMKRHDCCCHVRLFIRESLQNVFDRPSVFLVEECLPGISLLVSRGISSCRYHSW